MDHVDGGGLVYAALQLRGWRTAQHVANVTKLIELQLQLRKMMVEDPSLARAGVSISAAMSPEDTRAHFYGLMQVSLFEIAWFGHRCGQLTDDYFSSWQENMMQIIKRPAFRKMWMSDQTKIMDHGFRKYMDRLIAADHPSENREEHTKKSAASRTAECKRLIGKSEVTASHY